MHNFRSEGLRVFKCGLVINPLVPFLGTTPDAKVMEPGCSMPYVLIEIKCPFANNTSTLDEKCVPGSPFYMKKRSDDEYYLDEKTPQGKQYYQQVQGQLALTGMP